MRILIVIMVIALAAVARASTFIGNGGSAGDVELLVARQQVTEALGIMVKESSAKCECREEFANHKMCEPLRNLKEAEARYCSQLLGAKAPEVLELLQSGRVSLHFTRGPMEVVQGGRSRAVDAVADPEKGEITFDLERFLQLTPSERVFLLSHELFHFTKRESALISDVGPAGPFVGEDGSLRLVNAMAAGVAMESLDNYLFARYATELKRPQGWKRNWIDFSGGSSKEQSGGVGPYGAEHARRSRVGFRHYWSEWGIDLSAKTLTRSKTLLGSVESEDKVSIFGTGLSYRLFPFRDPLTFMGQSHLALTASVEYLRGKFSVQDPFVGMEETMSAVGGSAAASYYFPVAWGFWLEVGASYDIHSYEYVKARAKYENDFSGYLGVSYGF